MTIPTDPAALPARRAVAAMFFANGIVMGAFAAQIPQFLPRLGLTETLVGLMIFGFGAGAVVAMALSGGLIARRGSVAVLRPLALLAAVALLPVALAGSVWTLAPAMALLGAAIGCMDVAMNANAVEVERRLGRAIMSSSHGFWSLGGFVGGSAGAWMVARWGVGPQALVVSGAALALVIAASRHLAGDAPPPRGPRAPARRRGPALPRRAVVWLLAAMALFSMVPEGSVLDWAAIYLERAHGADTVTAGLAFACFSAAMALMRFLGDGIRNRLGAVRTLRLSGLVAAAGIFGAGLAPGPAAAIAAFTLAGIGIANMVPILFSAAGNLSGMAPGEALSFVTATGYAGILVAPSAIGFLAERMGFAPIYLALSLLLGVVALLAAHAADAERGARAAA